MCRIQKEISRILRINLSSECSVCFFPSLLIYLIALFSIAQVFSVDVPHNGFDQKSWASDYCSISRNKEKCKKCDSGSHCSCHDSIGPKKRKDCSSCAAYEWTVPPCSTPSTIHQNKPIPFFKQKVLVGNDIQSNYPFGDFTLAPGDYQITVGLANNEGEKGPVINLQLNFFLNNQLIFTWPAVDTNEDNSAAPFISFSTTINAIGSSSFLQIFTNETIVYDETETGGTIAFLTICKLCPEKALLQ